MQRSLTAAILVYGYINQARKIMLTWVLSFLIIAIIAGVLGFTGIAVAATDIAKVIFFIFLVLFIVSLVLSFVKW